MVGNQKPQVTGQGCILIFSNTILSIIFSVLGDLAWSIIKGPLEAVVGMVYGVCVGAIIWYIPAKSSVRTNYAKNV